MKKPTPEKIYRHRGYVASDLSNSTLVNRLRVEINRASSGQTWFSKLGSQNDPFDTNPHFIDSKLIEVKEFYEAYRKIAGPYASFYSQDFVQDAKQHGLKKSHAKKHLKNYGLQISIIRKTFQDYRTNAPICCFTERCDSVLMWSYYSNSHASFSYEFSLPPEHIEKGHLAVADVRYIKERPALTTIDMMRRMAQQRFPKQYSESGDESERVDNATFLCKSTDWQHEYEWRALRTPDEPTGFHSIAPYKPSNIIFGANADDALVKFIANVTSSSIGLLKCELDKQSYKLHMKVLRGV